MGRIPHPSLDRTGATRRAALAGAGALALAACAPRGADSTGLLRVAIDGPPDSLDPARGQFATAALVYKQLHAPLTDYGPDGALAPGLAESWTAEAGGRRWVFTLRENLRWSDGAPLTADDVVFSARRVLDPAHSFAAIKDFYAVSNAMAVLTGAAPTETLGVSAPDARTVVFELDSAQAVFPLLMREFYPFPAHAIAAHGDRWVRLENWVSSGPFVLSGLHSLGLRMRKNPHFHGAADVGSEEIAVEAVDDAATRARMFRAGEYDLAAAPPSSQIPFLRDALGTRFRGYNAPILAYLKINHARGPLSDVRVRRALSLAVDRGFIARELFSDTARPTERVIPGAEDAGATIDARRDEARALLAASGYGPDTPLRLELRATAGERERIAVVLADDFAQIGVAAEILATPPVDLYQAVDAGQYDLALARFDRGLKAEPVFMLEPFAPGGFADNMGWRDASFDQFAAAMDAARETLDDAAREAAYRAAEARLLDAQAIIPLLHERAFWLVGDRIAGAPGGVQPVLWRDLALREG